MSLFDRRHTEWKVWQNQIGYFITILTIIGPSKILKVSLSLVFMLELYPKCNTFPNHYVKKANDILLSLRVKQNIHSLAADRINYSLLISATLSIIFMFLSMLYLSFLFLMLFLLLLFFLRCCPCLLYCLLYCRSWVLSD